MIITSSCDSLGDDKSNLGEINGVSEVAEVVVEVVERSESEGSVKN